MTVLVLFVILGKPLFFKSTMNNKIKGKSVRSIKKLISLADKADRVKLVCDVSDKNSEVWENLGFNKILEIGDTLMPSCVGKTSQFNANGREIVRKDLPKENRSFSIYTSWTDWNGDPHSGFQDRTVKAYPKQYIEAPSENLSAISINDRLYIATQETFVADENEERNLHLMNLMLECFGEFEVFDVESGHHVGTNVRRLQWDVLPAGEYPWSKAKKIVQERTKNLDDSKRMVIEHRIKTISECNPDFLAIGKGGFTGYFVYGFKSKKIFILESIHLNNATYIFDKNWEELSKMTKNQIINSKTDVAYRRIIHDRRWKIKVKELIA